MSFAGEQDVFTDFKRTIYVDRLKPISAMDSAVVLAGNDRDVRTLSIDQTADKVWQFMNLPANISDAQVIALTNAGNGATQIDVDLFSKTFTNVINGNNVVTIVTARDHRQHERAAFRRAESADDQRRRARRSQSEQCFEVGDVTGTSYGIESIVYPNGSGTTNFAFNPAADLTNDGLIDSRDLYALPIQYANVNAAPAVKRAARDAVLRRGDMNQDGQTNVGRHRSHQPELRQHCCGDMIWTSMAGPRRAGRSR